MKEAFPLIQRGHDVHLIVESVRQGSEQFKTVNVWQDTDQLYEAIKLHKDADVWHAHNEPSWFVTAIKELLPSARVVLDVHDSCLLRKTAEEHAAELEENPAAFRVSSDERNNTQLADALVYVSDSMRRIVSSEFALPQPSIVLPSYVPLCLYRIDMQDWVGGLVYEGRIDAAEDLPDKWRSHFTYSDYQAFALKCREIGMDFHVYTPRGNEKLRKRYEDICYLHEPKPIDRLIKVLGSHDWGLVGNIKPFTEWANALPNKLFEYMAGCTPIVAMHAEESANFIREHGVGIVVDSPEELAERWAEHRQCREQVIKRRREFSMDAHIGELEALYKLVLS